MTDSIILSSRSTLTDSIILKSRSTMTDTIMLTSRNTSRILTSQSTRVFLWFLIGLY